MRRSYKSEDPISAHLNNTISQFSKRKSKSKISEDQPNPLSFIKPYKKVQIMK